MPQIINTNVASLNAQRNLNQSQTSLGVALQRLSSGLRINSAKDDAAGLAISERFTSQIRGLDQARRNANDGVSLSQTAEGSLEQMSALLQRVRELSVQSANATNSANDRTALNSEVGELVAELNRFAESTEFNGQKILNGSFTSAVYQVGANANQTITATSADFRTNKYGTYQVGASSFSGASTASTGVTGTTTAASGTSGALLSAGGNLTVKGKTTVTGIALTTGMSAKDVADAINTKPETGVNASAITETTVTFSASGSYSLDVYGTNSSQTSVSFSLSASSGADALSAAVTAFNNQSSKTGVTAKLDSTNGGVTLTSSTGTNIVLVAQTTGSAAGTITVSGGLGNLAAATSGNLTIGGRVLLDSPESYSVTSDGTLAFRSNAFNQAFAATTTKSGGLAAVSALDIGTVDGATQALRIVDSSITAISNQRAKFGALQSRFEATIQNLQTTSENLSASRSRIRDADFAAETAALTRSQILQQAGVSILAQANALPQNVLGLLQ